MSDLIDRIKAEYQTDLIRSLYVAEWDVTVYWRKVNLAERERFFKGPDTLSRHVDVVVAKAMDKDGKPLFNALQDKVQLLSAANPDVISVLAAAMLSYPTADQIAKN